MSDILVLANGNGRWVREVNRIVSGCPYQVTLSVFYDRGDFEEALRLEGRVVIISARFYDRATAEMLASTRRHQIYVIDDAAILRIDRSGLQTAVTLEEMTSVLILEDLKLASSTDTNFSHRNSISLDLSTTASRSELPSRYGGVANIQDSTPKRSDPNRDQVIDVNAIASGEPHPLANQREVKRRGIRDVDPRDINHEIRLDSPSQLPSHPNLEVGQIDIAERWQQLDGALGHQVSHRDLASRRDSTQMDRHQEASFDERWPKTDLENDLSSLGHVDTNEILHEEALGDYIGGDTTSLGSATLGNEALFEVDELDYPPIDFDQMIAGGGGDQNQGSRVRAGSEPRPPQQIHESQDPNGKASRGRGESYKSLEEGYLQRDYPANTFSERGVRGSLQHPTNADATTIDRATSDGVGGYVYPGDIYPEEKAKYNPKKDQSFTSSRFNSTELRSTGKGSDAPNLPTTEVGQRGTLGVEFTRSTRLNGRHNDEELDQSSPKSKMRALDSDQIKINDGATAERRSISTSKSSKRSNQRERHESSYLDLAKRLTIRKRGDQDGHRETESREPYPLTSKYQIGSGNLGEHLKFKGEEPLGVAIGVLGVGGSGTSTIAMALAQSFAGENRVNLVDLVVEGSQRMYHDIDVVQPGMAEAIAGSRLINVGDEYFERFKVPILERGYLLMLSVSHQSQLEAFRRSDLAGAIRTIKRTSDITIFDLDADFTESSIRDRSSTTSASPTEEALAELDGVLVVVNEDYRSLHRGVNIGRRLIMEGFSTSQIAIASNNNHQVTPSPIRQIRKLPKIICEFATSDRSKNFPLNSTMGMEDEHVTSQVEPIFFDVPYSKEVARIHDEVRPFPANFLKKLQPAIEFSANAKENRRGRLENANQPQRVKPRGGKTS